MEKMLNMYWDETAANEKYAADVAEAEQVMPRKTGARRSRNQKRKDTIAIGKKRYHQATSICANPDKIPAAHYLREHGVSRNEAPDNIHNIRAEQNAKAALMEFNVEFDVAEELVPA